MMKLIDFAHASDADYCYLQRQVDTLPPGYAYLFDACELPPGCTPTHVTIGFYKNAGQYVCFHEEIRYSGSSPILAALCRKPKLSFPDFTALRQFFRLLSPDPPVTVPDTEMRSLDAYLTNSTAAAGEPIPPQGSAPIPDYKYIQNELEKHIMGQPTATETIAHQAALHVNKRDPKKPLSIVAYGPPGTGKSEAAKTLAKTLSKHGPHRYTEVWTDLNQFTDSSSIHRLIGSPPGYVGYDDTPVFEAVAHNPYTVFIFDELDKAHPEVLKVFMSILDEGRCAARRELPDHTRQYDFRRCIFFFTSNYRLGAGQQKNIGFSLSDDVRDIRRTDDAVEVSYHGHHLTEGGETENITKRTYRNTETARKAFVAAGALREIASRFHCFVEFQALSEEAKKQILVKQVIETGFEYNIRLIYIAPTLMQELTTASISEKALTVRSFKAVIEGYLAAGFAQAGARYPGQAIRLEGTLEAPAFVPA